MNFNEEFDKLKTKVLKYVLYKKRTEAEVRLKFREETEEVLDEVIGFLKEEHYIDDLNYIKRAVNEFFNLKNMSIKEVKYKLISKGLPTKLIEEYFLNNNEALLDYEKQSAKNIFTKKKDIMTKEEIEIYLLKKGYLKDTIDECNNEQ